MRTLLSQFCDEFDAAIRPVLTPLSRVTDTLAISGERLGVRDAIPTLLDLRHQLGALADKVAEQQAYVLIFGPLKSGKSTLMNAMSAAYVSEVTCLPAYPCMVYVSHSSTRKYELTSYNANVKGYTDPAAMRQEVIRAHGDLADRIREVEAAGDEFDPAEHWPQAIRKVDVRVPAGALESSGAVLVDTPGLYSRMKFGYDRMTRDFRNAAACAIFVVKTDNLFLEQVFAEFNELLELFSRIFLVVNLDTQKKDLRPDGSLAPSLESAEPQQVIEAFETLAMSAPLKQAADEGRLGIYPVDLLQAASQRIQSQSPSETPPDSPTTVQARQGFDRFLGDLTEYLNSTDYLVSFLGDSLTRATNLLDEIEQASDHPALHRLEGTLGELGQEKNLAETKKAVLERLDRNDWRSVFEVLRTELAEKSRGPLNDVRAETEDQLSEIVDDWFESDDSLQALVSPIAAAFEGCETRIAETVVEALRERVQLGSGGLVMPERLVRDLEAGHVEIDAIGRQQLDDTAPKPARKTTETLLAAGDIPVRKGFWDYVLFRGQAKMSQRLFGRDTGPTRRIPRSLKAKRLGPDAREAMVMRLDDALENRFQAEVEEHTHETFNKYSDSVISELQRSIASKKDAIGKHVSEITERFTEAQSVIDDVRALAAEVDRVSESVVDLQARYAEAKPDDLIQTVAAPEPTESAPAPAPEVDRSELATE